MIRGKITMVAAAQETMMTSAHMAKKIIRVSRYGLPCTTLRLTIQRAIYSVIPAALMMLVKAKKKNSSSVNWLSVRKKLAPGWS